MILFPLVWACKQEKEKPYAPKPKEWKNSGKLTSIDYKDPHLAFIPKDTITAGGWKIQYFVKDDSTRYNDLYIKWSKGDRIGIFKYKDVLLMRSYFIPQYAGENKTHLFLEHGCATSCWAVLVLSKGIKPQAIDFTYVSDFSIKYGRVVYLPEMSYGMESFDVAVFDLNTNTQKLVHFKNICKIIEEIDCLDSVLFKKNSLHLFASLISTETDEIIRESYQVIFPK